MPKGEPFRRVTVVGLARTGRALVEALAPRGARLFVSEGRALTPEEREFLRAHGAAWEEGGHTDRALEADLLVPSPGVPSHAPLLQEAQRRGIPILAEIELAFRLARPAVLVAVTGTNGKTTTTELVGAILRAAGRDPVVAGNIGRPAVSTVDEVQGRPWVLEVSSYQLEWTEAFRPQVAVWLNFAPDHLDHHGTLAAYFAAKARILARQTEEDWAVLPPDLLARLSPRAQAVDYSGVELPEGWGEGLVPHLRDDLRAAWAAAGCAFPELQAAPPPYERVAPALRQPHRMEVVGEIGGIPFVDDSKGTNAHATAAALAAIEGPVVLILGGRHKGGGYEDLLPLLRAKARACVLIGESQDYFAALLAPTGVPYQPAGDPDDALRRAYRLARPGDTVLLSPACASFDQFRDYAHRGEAFQAAFQKLARGH
ncbi:MAG: UDP-N-acetylmuramoyl-L-alanine--D-glutamate ligase [Candidatus Bipolaricaulota bacterium]|nr:UDP-N-acetylmuramoyl-L-alanine--D-glutamate ligase [Candidatus Bipolaricaulota bacterium]